MAHWLGGFGNVLLGLLPVFPLLHIGGDELLAPLRLVADDKAHVGQGNTALCPCVGEKSDPLDLVGLGEVGNVIPFWAHWRVAGLGTPWRHHCIWTVGLRRRDWRGF